MPVAPTGRGRETARGSSVSLTSSTGTVDIRNWSKNPNRQTVEGQAPDKLARETGLEPATSGVTGRRSNQLSYSRKGEGWHLGPAAGAVKRRKSALTTGGR